MLTNNVYIHNRGPSQFKPDFDPVIRQLHYPTRFYYLVKNNGPLGNTWAVLLHQYGYKAEEMVKRGKIYYKNGLSLLFLDARSHGRSSYHKESNALLFARDALEIIEKEEITEIIINGISFGGIATVFLAKLIHAENKPISVKALVLEGVPKDITNVYDYMLNANRLLKILYFWVPKYIKFRRRKYDWKNNGPVNILEQIKVPFLLIHGEKDKLFPPPEHIPAFEFLLTLIPNSQIWIASNSGHAQMHFHPEWPMVLDEFISKLMSLEFK